MVIEVTMAEAEMKDIKLAKSSVNTINNPAMNGLVFTNEVDKLEVPKDYQKLIKTCRFFYRYDAIAGTILNKICDITITPIANRRGECTDEEYETYNALAEMLQEFFRNACLEYLLSGMVVPHYEWEKMRGSELTPKLGSRRRVTVPSNVWFRDPSSIEIKNSPIPNKKTYYVKVDSDTIYFIKSKGVHMDGTRDEELYRELVKNYPEFVKQVLKASGVNLRIKLSDVRPILARTLPEDPYPIPYMSNALESLMHKRNLKRMDYSIASRVIGAIQLIKLGSDEFPCTEESDFDEIKTQMNYRTSSGYNERIFQLFSNHTLAIEWVMPDTSTMLSREKYSVVEDDIISAFGFPRTLITGETLRSNVAGGSDFAAFSPIATMETIRDKFIDWLIVLYKEIKEKNGFKNSAIPHWTPMRLYKLLDLNAIGQSLYMEGNISRTTRQEMVGLDFDNEVERKEAEKNVYKERGIPEAPEVPFSSPNIGNNTPKTTQTKETTNKKEK